MSALLQFIGLIIGTLILILLLFYAPWLFLIGFLVAFFGLIIDSLIEKVQRVKKS